MTFVRYAIQHRELSSDFTQFEPILSYLSSYSLTSRIRSDKKRSLAGQMVVNNQGKIVSLNQKFISIWKLPQSVVTARCERQVFQFVAKQLENPHDFLVNIGKIHEQMDLEIQDLVESEDGRYFSHLIKPQWSEKRVIGRIYQFWSL